MIITNKATTYWKKAKKDLLTITADATGRIYVVNGYNAFIILPIEYFEYVQKVSLCMPPKNGEVINLSGRKLEHKTIIDLFSAAEKTQTAEAIKTGIYFTIGKDEVELFLGESEPILIKREFTEMVDWSVAGSIKCNSKNSTMLIKTDLDTAAILMPLRPTPGDKVTDQINKVYQALK